VESFLEKDQTKKHDEHKIQQKIRRVNVWKLEENIQENLGESGKFLRKRSDKRRQA